MGKKEHRTPEEVVNIHTSRWCSVMPVVTMFTVGGLRAESEYVDIRVRARNDQGLSEWSKPLESAWTMSMRVHTTLTCAAACVLCF